MAENVLGALFGEIANAIRSKTDDTATMKPIEFPEKILGINNSSSVGNVLDNVEITPDFSSGNMTESLPEGYSARSATIIKPKTLEPYNIAEGVTIAGILGTHKGGGSDGSAVQKEGNLKWNGTEEIVYHELGVTPDLIIITAGTQGTTANVMAMIIAFSKAYMEKLGLVNGVWSFITNGSHVKNDLSLDAQTPNNIAESWSGVYGGNGSIFKITNGKSITFTTGKNVRWVAFGNLV